jgi:hypothetical protein
MSEQLVNLYSSTLAAPYVAGSGAITVASAGLYTSGTFSLTILDAGTGAVILIFRVASVAGVVFTGQSEGPDGTLGAGDANAASGSIVIGSMLTVDAMAQLFIDHGGGGGGFIQPLTPPVHGAFTPINFNTGGCTTTQVNNTSPVTSINLSQLDPSSSLEIAGLTKAPINALFTVTVAVSLVGFSGNSQSVIGGLWLTDGSAVNIAFVCNSANALEVLVFDNFSGLFDSVPFGSVLAPFPLGPLVWFRIQETISARIYSISADGISFVPIFSESNTAHLITAQYGVMVEGRNTISAAGVSMGWYSFTETTP